MEGKFLVDLILCTGRVCNCCTHSGSLKSLKLSNTVAGRCEPTGTTFGLWYHMGCAKHVNPRRVQSLQVKIKNIVVLIWFLCSSSCLKLGSLYYSACLKRRSLYYSAKLIPKFMPVGTYLFSFLINDNSKQYLRHENVWKKFVVVWIFISSVAEPEPPGAGAAQKSGCSATLLISC